MMSLRQMMIFAAPLFVVLSSSNMVLVEPFSNTLPHYSAFRHVGRWTSKATPVRVMKLSEGPLHSDSTLRNPNYCSRTHVDSLSLQAKKSDDNEPSLNSTSDKKILPGATASGTNGASEPETDTKALKRNGELKSETSTRTKALKTKRTRRRKMELSWCGRDSCTLFEDGLREKVVGEHNEITFESPATGQVAYQWSSVDGLKDEDIILSRVLILIKRNDDELLKAASEVSLIVISILAEQKYISIDIFLVALVILIFLSTPS